MSKIVFAARVEDRDDPAWTQVSARTEEHIALRANRFHRQELQNPKAREECIGIKVNIWNRTKNWPGTEQQALFSAGQGGSLFV